MRKAQNEKEGLNKGVSAASLAHSNNQSFRDDEDGPGRQPLNYKEWLKHKDAERRLKRKLIT